MCTVHCSAASPRRTARAPLPVSAADMPAWRRAALHAAALRPLLHARLTCRTRAPAVTPAASALALAALALAAAGAAPTAGVVVHADARCCTGKVRASCLHLSRLRSLRLARRALTPRLLEAPGVLARRGAARHAAAAAGCGSAALARTRQRCASCWNACARGLPRVTHICVDTSRLVAVQRVLMERDIASGHLPKCHAGWMAHMPATSEAVLPAPDSQDQMTAAAARASRCVPYPPRTTLRRPGLTAESPAFVPFRPAIVPPRAPPAAR